jgi:hypothetical protein
MMIFTVKTYTDALPIKAFAGASPDQRLSSVSPVVNKIITLEKTLWEV